MVSPIVFGLSGAMLFAAGNQGLRLNELLLSFNN